MQGFKKDKGIASAVQSAIKMFFTGVGLIIFSYIKLESILQIVFIFILLRFLAIILWQLAKTSKINKTKS